MTTQHSIQDIITRHMPKKLAIKLLRQEVITISDLRRGAQEDGIYETCIANKYENSEKFARTIDCQNNFWSNNE